MRGIAALVISMITFLLMDLIQRTLIVVIIKARPRSRESVLTRWLGIVAAVVLDTVRLAGGARLEIAARIPGEPGTLVLMNHQSLLDIPVAVRCITGGYPIIVTRERYAKGRPVISHMVRLYGHPTVRPGEYAGPQLETLRTIAANADHPVLIYPEGTRTRDGAIRPFKKAGLKAILSARPWSVHVLVGDGMWRASGLRGFIDNLSSTTIRAESVGPFAFDNRKDDVDAFIGAMEGCMSRKLSEMRGAEKAA